MGSNVLVIKPLTEDEYRQCVERFACFEAALGTIQRTKCFEPVESQGAVVWQLRFERVDVNLICRIFNSHCPGDSAIIESGNVFIFRLYPRPTGKVGSAGGQNVRAWQAAAFLGALLLLLYLLLTSGLLETSLIRTMMIRFLQSLDHHHANA
jgi:hypothetical protein